jgi:hypothetical protein
VKDLKEREVGLSEDLRLIYRTRLDTLGRARIVISIVLIPIMIWPAILFWFLSGLVGWVYRAHLNESNKDLHRSE